MKRNEERFNSVSADLLRPGPLGARLLIVFIGLMLSAGVTWSYFATVIEVSTGNGRVIPERRLQVVQSLEGGVVQSILVRAGDRVTEGDVIARFNSTSAVAARDESAAQLAGLDATITGLAAQLRILAAVEARWKKLNADGAKPGFGALDGGGGKPLQAFGLLMEHLENVQLEFSQQVLTLYPQFARQSREQLRWALLELANSLSILEQQMLQKSSERLEAALRLQSLDESLKIAKEDQASLEKLLKTGAAGKAELNEAKSRRLEIESSQQQTLQSISGIEAGIAEIEGRIAERVSNFRSEASRQISEAEIRREAISSTLAALELRTANTEIRASATGILKTMQVTSIGQVVKSGDSIAEIVPTLGEQLIEVRVKPEDIAFIEGGMPAIVKLTAYDFSIFGSLQGVVERISEDSTTDEKGNSYYLVDVRAFSDHIQRKGRQWPVKVGMVANVDIITGKRSVLQYLTKPIHRMTMMALRER